MPIGVERAAVTGQPRGGLPERLEHAFVEVRGIRLHLARLRPAASGRASAEAAAVGDDERRQLVLFIHGFPEFWYSWRHQLAAFGDRYDCVAPDTRGYNLSDKPVDGYDIDSLADDQAELIAALGYERAVVIGHDWGAATAWHLAQRHPARVERLVILNCPPIDLLLRHLLTNWRQIRRSYYIAAFQLPGIERKLAANDAALIRRALVSSTARSTRERAFSPEDLDHYAEAMLRPKALTAALAYYRSAARDALWPSRRARILDTEPIRAPTLVVWGVDDPALGVELTYGLHRRCAAGLTLRYINDCGHFVHQERPAQVNEAIDGFLGAEL
jgi:pimeloyl-ACP methyl ester carboxylesterase